MLKDLLKIFCDEHLTCELCGCEVFEGRFCESCQKKIKKNDKDICDHCGRATDIPLAYCIECKGADTGYFKARSAFLYNEEFPKLIYGYKNGKKYLSQLFADELTATYYKDFFRTDALIYVPMYKKDELERGFNQSQLLAKELSKKVNVSIISALTKIAPTLEQKVLSKKDRAKNLQGSIRVSARKSIKDKNLLLIDDVMTTGATAELISKKLLKAGAKSVGVLTVASVPLAKVKTNKDCKILFFT